MVVGSKRGISHVEFCVEDTLNVNDIGLEILQRFTRKLHYGIAYMTDVLE